MISFLVVGTGIKGSFIVCLAIETLYPFHTGLDKFLRREKLARICFQFTRDPRTVQVLKRQGVNFL